jgi:hypothetical protein
MRVEVDKEPMQSNGELSPNTRKLIENLAEGSVISEASDSQTADSSSGGASGGAPPRPAPQQMPGVGSGPVHMLYPGGQMLPVGHALHFLGAQQQLAAQQMQQMTPAAQQMQQMMMLYLQGQHATFLQHQAAMGAASQPAQMKPPAQSPATADGGSGAHSGVAASGQAAAHEGAQPSMIGEAEMSLARIKEKQQQKLHEEQQRVQVSAKPACRHMSTCHATTLPTTRGATTSAAPNFSLQPNTKRRRSGGADVTLDL